MDPSAEMQKEAREKRRNLPVQETAEEFFLDLKISQCFDYSVHLILSIPMILIYHEIFRSLRSSGSCDQIGPKLTPFGAANTYHLYKGTASSQTENKVILREHAYESFFHMRVL